MKLAIEFEVLAAAKGFDRAMSPKIKFTKEYQDLKRIIYSTAAETIIKNSVKYNNLAMAYLHMYVESARAKVCLVKSFNYKYPKGLFHEAWKKLHK